MTIWLIRAFGGEYAPKFIQDNRVYIGWGGLNVDISRLQRHELANKMYELYREDRPVRTISIWVGEVWAFVHKIEIGNLVVLPLDGKTIQIGQITGVYHYEPQGPDPWFHWCPVTWLGTPIPRNQFGEDFRRKFAIPLTISRIKDKEARIEQWLRNERLL